MKVCKNNCRKGACITKACKNANYYKGTRLPTCNHGNPCNACISKYITVMASKLTATIIKILFESISKTSKIKK